MKDVMVKDVMEMTDQELEAELASWNPSIRFEASKRDDVRGVIQWFRNGAPGCHGGAKAQADRAKKMDIYKILCLEMNFLCGFQVDQTMRDQDRARCESWRTAPKKAFDREFRQVRTRVEQWLMDPARLNALTDGARRELAELGKKRRALEA